MNNHQGNNFNCQLWGGQRSRLAGSFLSDRSPKTQTHLLLPSSSGFHSGDFFPACSAAQLSAPAHYITMATTAVGQPDQFFTGSETNELTKPNVAAASYSHLYVHRAQLQPFALFCRSKQKRTSSAKCRTQGRNSSLGK